MSFRLLVCLLFISAGLAACGGSSNTTKDKGTPAPGAGGTNVAPIAKITGPASAGLGEVVRLSGSASSDANGDTLTYAWELTSAPTGSNAALSSTDSVSTRFTVDVEGDYVISLVVNDGALDSRAADTTVAAGGANQPPVADAGRDQKVPVGADVALDGTASEDPEGEPLTYQWELTVVPDGSFAELSDPTDAAPTFNADLPGDYVVELVVNDGQLDSAVDHVSITALEGNVPPVADAGPDQMAATGDTVALDGSGSTDAEGAQLTYQWEIVSQPAGSQAALSDATIVNPTFVADVDGEYVLHLVVNDGEFDSTPDAVTINVGAGAGLAADAGPDQNVMMGDAVTLDGSGSTVPDGATIQYMWDLVAIPTDSAATLKNATTGSPTFDADMPGHYVAKLVVSDGTNSSDPDYVVIMASADNAVPIANAGGDQTVVVNTAVTLDGSGSSDANQDTLTYSWSLTSMPNGSTATLADETTAAPSFTPDVAGSYVVSLTVNDGLVDSLPDAVVITVTAAAGGSNSPPLADAGNNQTVAVGAPATLDGTGSSDPDGDALTYSWTLTTMPQGSTAAIVDGTTEMASLTPDVAGDYVVTLIVNDGQVDSEPVSVMVTATDAAPANRAPVADAGLDQIGTIGVPAFLDGSGSRDPDGDTLKFAWTMTGRPVGSSATLSGATTSSASFTPDVDGDYLITLVVNDGILNSAPSTVTVSTTPGIGFGL